MKLRLLDLFSGAGGSARGYQQAGFYVVGVDIKPQPRYAGDEFVQADALEYVAAHGAEFDVIHASPPCQAYTAMQHIHKHRIQHPDLIAPVRGMLESFGKPFVIENVIGAPLKYATLLLCGTMFGLKVAKHRVFESSIPLPLLLPPCNHADLYDRFHGGEMARGERAKYAAAQGIDWFMTRPEVRNAIPPAFTKYIGAQLMRALVAA